MEEDSPKPPTSTTFGKLPGDVSTSILIRLPAKHLAQLRSVSKSFNKLISHPSFIKSHLQRSTHDQTLMFIHNGFCFNHFHKPITLPETSIKLPESFYLPPGYLRSNVIASVNGLICFMLTCVLGFVNPLIYIWNPSLSIVTAVAPFTVVGHDHGVADVHLGFGFDPVNDDYKVVKFARLYRATGLGKGGYIFHDWLEVEVYSMKKGSWGVISDRFPSSVECVYDDKKVSITGSDGRDGRVHWLSRGSLGTNQMIVAFDFGMETFSEMPVPESVAKQRIDRADVLGVLGGKVCVMSCVNGEFEVWVMGEYGVGESWVKEYVFSQFGRGIVPIGVTLKNEFVFKGDDNRLALYDQNADEVKSLNVTVQGWDPLNKVMIVPYVDSLVWIAPAN